MDWEAFYSAFRKPGFIAGYEIQNRLGGGAFGEVYKARKASIGKAYAIKFLKIDDEAQREAVERELEQVRHFAVIDHANLVTIEDLGTALGVPYLIMGYAGEDTLARRMRAGTLDRKQALSYFVQTCRGVLALHDRRLVHFDLKPSNVFLKGDAARVGDYGLSKMMTDGRLTLSFGRGTPHYMAPEMLKSRADHRADIYSLGVILFESLTGRLPFESEVPGTVVVREDDTPPVFPEDFPAELRPVVECCLRLDPSQRYASLAELLEELGQTARPGDSVRIVLERPDAPLRPRPAAAPSARPVDGEPTPSTARQTAAHLARGAVDVVRGVVDGLKTMRRRAEPAPPGRAPPAPPAPGGEPGRDPARQPGPLRMQAVDATARGAAPGEGGATAAVGAGTIPVPPRVQGGFWRSLGATLALGVEMLVAMGQWLVRRVPQGFASATAHLLRGAGGLVARTVRLVLFLLVLALVGGAVTGLALLLLSGT
jgi:serine/threonine-protein kinase